MRSEMTKRNFIAVILLYFFTFGIYAIYLFFAFGSELRRETIRQNCRTVLTTPLVAFLLGLITFGIYMIYYMYKQAVALEEIGKKYNYDSFSPVLIVLLAIFVGIGGILNVFSGSQIAYVMEGETPRF